METESPTNIASEDVVFISYSRTVRDVYGSHTSEIWQHLNLDFF